MSDSWLERGHGPQPSHLAVIFKSTAGSQPLGIRDAFGSSRPTAPSTVAARVSRRGSHLLVVTALWLGIAVGAGGAAWAVQDALFPTIGPTAVSVWQNPGRQPEPASIGPATNTTTTSSVPSSTGVPTTEASPSSSIGSGGSIPSSGDAGDSSGPPVSGSGNSGSGNSGSGSGNSGSGNSGSGSGNSGSGGDDGNATTSPTPSTMDEDVTSTSIDDHGGRSATPTSNPPTTTAENPTNTTIDAEDGSSGSGGGSGSNGGSGSGGGSDD